MVRLLRCLVLAQSTPKLHHKEAKRRFIVSIAVFSHKQLKRHICFHFTRGVWRADSPLPAIFGKKICIIHKRYKRSFKSRMASYFTKLQYDK